VLALVAVAEIHVDDQPARGSQSLRISTSTAGRTSGRSNDYVEECGLMPHIIDNYGDESVRSVLDLGVALETTHFVSHNEAMK
jgi:hypothetical protein